MEFPIQYMMALSEASCWRELCFVVTLSSDFVELKLQFSFSKFYHRVLFQEMSL